MCLSWISYARQTHEENIAYKKDFHELIQNPSL